MGLDVSGSELESGVQPMIASRIPYLSRLGENGRYLRQTVDMQRRTFSRQSGSYGCESAVYLTDHCPRRSKCVEKKCRAAHQSPGWRGIGVIQLKCGI